MCTNTLFSSCSGYPLLLRHKATAQNLQRGIRYYPAAIGQQDFYLAFIEAATQVRRSPSDLGKCKNKADVANIRLINV